MRNVFLSMMLFAVVFILGAQDQPAPAAQEQKEQILPQFTKAQLEQLVAPIALYPDDLLAQVLAASTYPLDIVEAARFLKRNPSLNQDDINTELKNKGWDPSVKGLVFFPELLAKMNDNLDWSKDLGDAFLTQQKDIMDTIQIMRGKATEAGTLKSDANQKVTTSTEGQTEIQSTNPETVYVQNYEPSTAYGPSWGYDDWDYPNVIVAPAWPWGGVYSRAWLGYNCGWGNHAVAYGNNYYNGSFYRNNLRNANINPANRTWAHDQARSRAPASNTQQIAKQLETSRSTAQSQAVPQGDRTQAAAKALQNADRAQVADRVQNANRDGQNVANRAQTANRDGQNIANRAQNVPQQKAEPALSGSRNANLERTYSNRGAQSRTVSAQTTGRGGSVQSHAGGAARGGAGGGGVRR